ncbi:MAG: EAL domain-containing protein [Pseudomonadota bacterium]
MLTDQSAPSRFSQDAIRQIFDLSPDPYWIIDPASSAFLHANRESELQLGFSLDEILELKIGVVDVNLAISSPQKWREITSGIMPGETLRYLADLRCKTGDLVTVEITISLLVVDEREVFFAITRDVSKIAAIEAQLASRERLLQTVFRTMTEGILVVGADNRCLLSNQRLADLLGFDSSILDGGELSTTFDDLQLSHAPFLSSEKFPMANALQSGQPVTDLLLKARFANDQVKWLIANATPLCDDTLKGSVLTLTDVTEMKRSQARVDYMSVTDMLTDLPNRSQLLTQLGLTIRQCMEEGSWAALLVVNIDRFKLVNETRGHSVGDDLLLRFSDRLRAHVPAHGLLARIGADEFAFILKVEAPSFKDARRQADKFAAMLLESIHQPFLSRYETIQICASIGMALTDGGTAVAETMLQYGSIALVLAKESGGDCSRVFEPAMLEAPKSRYYAESALRDGLRADEFELYFQPKVDMRSGNLKGVEALIRWNRHGQGTIGPDLFIGVAERSNLIVPLGDWMIREACRAVSHMRTLGLDKKLGKVSINVSPRQFQQSDFVARLKAIVEEENIEPDSLCIELTETALVNDTDHVVASLGQLNRDGFSISIDDFGSGYSSFAYLQRFPVKEIKIDRSFINEIDCSEQGRVIVRAMLAMGNALGVTVVAEGIEKIRQQELLLEFGCLIGQGYLFAKPMALEPLVNWMGQRPH